MTRKLWLAIALSLALFLIGVNTQAGWLFVVVALVVAASIYSAFFSRRMLTGLDVDRILPKEAFEDQAIDVRLAIANRGKRNRFMIQVRDGLAGQVDKVPVETERKGTDGGDVGRLSVAVLRPGVREEKVYQIAFPRRGVYTGGVELLSSAPFGLLTSRRRLPAPPITVYPRYVDLANFPLIEAASTPSESYHERGRKGGGLEYYGTREHRPGESLRFIHWPSSARTGRVMVKEFEQELGGVVTLALDAAAGTDVGRPGQSTLDAICRLAASIARYAATSGHPITLAAATGEKLEVVSYASWWGCLDFLAGVGAEGAVSFPEVIRGLSSSLAPRTSVVLLCRPQDGLMEAVQELQEKRVRVIAVLVDLATEVVFAEDVARSLALHRAIVYLCHPADDMSRSLSEPYRHEADV